MNEAPGSMCLLLSQEKKKLFPLLFNNPLPYVAWASSGFGSYRSVLSNMVATFGYLYLNELKLNKISVPRHTKHSLRANSHI